MKQTPKSKIERNGFMIKVHAFFVFFFKTKNSGGDLALNFSADRVAIRTQCRHQPEVRTLPGPCK